MLLLLFGNRGEIRIASNVDESRASTSLHEARGEEGRSRLSAPGPPTPRAHKVASVSPKNYVSCHTDDNKAPLRWPDVPYQILGGPTDNKVVFDQRNGMYIFFLSIVDPHYR